MNLQQLEYLIALDTHRQFVGAANSCCVTQPALSMQLQKLEEELGVLLFDRKKKRLEPTAIGVKVVQHARHVLREVQLLREVVQVEKDELVGEVRLGIIPTLAPYLVPLFLVPLAERHPQLHVRVEELQSEELVRRLKAHQVDIGLLITPLDDSQLREVALLEEPFLGYVSESHPLYAHVMLRPADLSSTGLWLLQQGHCFRNQVLTICSPPNGAQAYTYESGSIETLKELVRRNHGYTLVPELSVLTEADHNPMVKRFEAPEPVREVSMVVHHGFVRTQLLNTLYQLILEQVPERLHAGRDTRKISWQ
ncbi:LysR substrate-binding domain-containing protein [Hymenobacter sp. HD11105]